MSWYCFTLYIHCMCTIQCNSINIDYSCFIPRSRSLCTQREPKYAAQVSYISAIRIHSYVYTRTTHAYDASHHFKCHAAWMGRAGEVSGIACLVGMGVQRTERKNGNVKNEAKYLACPIHAFYFWFDSFLFFCHWLLRWADIFAFHSQRRQPSAVFNTRL